MKSVTVDFFQGKQKTLYLTALFVSFAVAAAGWLSAFLLPPRGSEEHDFTLNILLAVVAVAGTGIFLVCIITAKMRTSKWVADENGIAYSAFGIRLLSLAWKDVKEVAFLKIIHPRRHVTAYYLYWTTEELASACRSFMKGGVLEHKPQTLGRYNCRKGSIVLYALDPDDPANDPLVKFTQEIYPHPIKNPKVLQWAAEAAEKGE